MIPFLDSEMMRGCNPIKLYEFLESKKPVISTIKFVDYPEHYYIVNQENVNTIINRLLFSEQSTLFNDRNKNMILPYWEDVCKKLYSQITILKRQHVQKSKKCAYVTNMLVDWKTLEPRFGGGEKYALAISRLLKEHNVQVDFYQMADTTCETTYYGFPVYCLSMKGLETYQEFCVGYSKQVNEIIKNKQYDFVIYGMPEMCCSDNVVQNSISINHGIWFDRTTIVKDATWYSYMETHVKYPSINVSVDTNFINFIRTMHPEYGCKLNYIPNFYDSNNYQFTEKNNEKMVIVIPRRASMYRGSRIMGEILNLINHDVEIIWVGKGDIDDNKILEELTKIDMRFKFTGCSFDEMKNYYSKADIVIIPTIASEGTSLSCIEAMACGCAVVSTNIGGLCNLITDHYNGLLVNPNPKEIASAVNELITNKGLRLKLIDNAKTIVTQYSEEKWKRKWLDIFSKMGWIYEDNNYQQHNYFVKLNRDDLERNFNIFWKNYVHYYELQQKIYTEIGAFEHFKNNEIFEEMYICNPSTKIAVFTRHAINGGVESIIAEEAKYFNMDIYVTNGIQDKLNPFLYENVKDIDDVLRIVKNYDIIIYHWIPEFALQAIKLSKKPAIEYLHRRDTDNNDKTVPIDIVSHSPFLINHCHTKFNKSCVLLEHPINTSKFYPKTTYDSYIGCFCTYNQIKGIDILISALKNVRFKVSSLEWEKYTIVFFGKNQQNYKEYLQQLAKENGVNCEFRDSVNTWEHINKYKLFIIPSRLEGLPVVLLEALACNIPVISSELEGIIEFYNIAKERGYDNLFQMFKSEDVKDLTQKIFEWFQCPFTNDRGYEYIKKYYSTSVHCNKFMNILSQYVNKYQSHNDKVICSEITKVDTYLVKASDNGTKLIEYFENTEISFDKFLRHIIKIDDKYGKFKQIEVILTVKNITTPIPTGYQFDLISNSTTSYKSDTTVISMSGIKSICSPELELNNVKTLNINIRPNYGKIHIDDVHIVAYY
jgi:glycosyltransferase involved in cell wall biosynthesis